MTEPVRITAGDVVARKDNDDRQPRGVVLAVYELRQATVDALPAAPLKPGRFAVVLWHTRMRPRVESAEGLTRTAKVVSLG